MFGWLILEEHFCHRITPHWIRVRLNFGSIVGMKSVCDCHICSILLKFIRDIFHQIRFFPKHFCSGVYDLPAQIDYVLEQTQQEQLSFIGHSQGATVGFVLLTELPEYSKKVKIFHAMAPPVIFRHCSAPTMLLVNNIKPLQRLAIVLKMYNIAPRSLVLPFIKQLGAICSIPEVVPICKLIMDVLAGPTAPKSWYPVSDESLIYGNIFCGNIRV